MIDGFMGFILPEFSGPMGTTAEMLNSQQYMDIFNRITNIALSRFVWKGLPDTCRPEILEQTLYFYGRALFFKDPDLGFCHTPVNLQGPYNIYYQSIIRHAYSFEYHKDYDITNSVVIKANHSMFPDYLTTWNYTPKISNTLRAIDVHVETLKRPFIIRCAEKEKNSVKQAINNIARNEIAVIGQKFGNEIPLEVLSTGEVSNLEGMWATVKNYLNQCYSSLGVKNNYTEKRERMITTEAEGETNAVRHSLESELEERQSAAELINEMFGLNVSVEANELETFTDELMELQAARVTGLTNQGEYPEEEVE